VDYDGDFWADHDPDCHGEYHDFEDDSDYVEGFIWSCCDKPGDDVGCKSTKHKSKTNIVVGPASALSKKRKAEEEIPRAVFARCTNCEKRFNANQNERGDCVYHPGRPHVLISG